MTVLCCPDKFRGTLTAPAAAHAMATGFAAAGRTDTVELPLADGGEGTLDVLLAACGGEARSVRVTGPEGREVIAQLGLLLDGIAVVEMARASGLALVAGRNDPLTATTYGTGELIRLAVESGATSVVVGVGGSATVDGGRGALDALGWQTPAIPVVVACDVTIGFLDAARIFGPQKGAGPEEVAELSERLARFAAELWERTGVDVRNLPGSGAAGGLAGGLAALGATLRPGFRVVADAVGLDRRLDGASFVVTGEGRLDRTSLSGKVVGEVLRVAAALEIRAGVVAGEVADDAAVGLPGGADVVSLVTLAGSAEEARSRAAELVSEATELLARGLA